MEDSEPNYTTDESEEIEMFRIDTGMRIDLKGVVIMRRIFEKAIEGIEHLVRQQEEELSADTLAQRPIIRGKSAPVYLDSPP